MPDRAYDVVLLGATGFTGRLTALHLDKRVGAAGTRWALAGRNQGKLEVIAAELDSDPAIEVVDIADRDGLTELAARTRVIATTVGPYTGRGEAVVAACIAGGSDYLDITGEPRFVAGVRRDHGAAAEAAAVRIVNCCGFDSVPPDLGVQWTVEHLPEDVPLTVRGYVWAKGRPSGGTARTSLDIVASTSPSSLRGGGPGSGRSRPEGGRRVRGLPPRIHRVRDLDAYAVPLPTIDASVVMRSARALRRYGPDFRYGHFAQLPNLPVAVGAVAAAGVTAGLARFPPARAVIERFLPAAGDGPPPEVRARSRFRLTFIGEGGGERVVTRVTGGDPGYDETAVMLGEAALAMAHDKLPASAGVVTPAQALGAPYRDRLVSQGIAFEVLEDHA